MTTSHIELHGSIQASGLAARVPSANGPLPHMGDDLALRFASGEPAALRDLYRIYSRPVYAVAFRVLNDAGLAEEAVQQAFEKAWRGAGRFDADRDLAPWLFTIARNVAIDLYRRERRHRSSDLDEADVAVLPPSLEDVWAVWEVRRALQRVPAPEREVLAMTHFEGLTHEEAAIRLGIPLGTVKSRSYRAYRRLSELLSHLRR